MSTMNVTLPDALRRFVEEQVVRGGYASADEYLRALVREARTRAELAQVEARLLEAVRGEPATPVTPETWARIEREGLEVLMSLHGDRDVEDAFGRDEGS